MPIDISIDDLTNAEKVSDGCGGYTWTGTGVFDKLLTSAVDNLNVQLNDGNVTKEQYASIYASIATASMSNSMQFVLQEKAIEADIDIKLKELEIKEAQLALTQRQIAEIEQSIELRANEDERAQTQLEDSLLTSSTQRTSVERDIANKEKQLEVSEAQRLEVTDGTLRANTQLESQLALTQRQIAQTEKQTANLENEDILRIAQIGKTKIEADVAYAIGAKDVDLKEQQRLKAIEETVLVSNQADKVNADIGAVNKQIEIQDFELTNMLPKQLEATDTQITQTNREVARIEKQIEQISAEIILIEQKHVGRKQ